MSLTSTTIMAFSMSADAFAVALGKGVTMKEPRLKEALKVGVLFGVVEAITPLLGWLAGTAASGFVASIDHWICFAILGLVGAKMIHESLQAKEDEAQVRAVSKRRKFALLLLTAVGTSLDAMAVGVSLAFMNANIWVSAAAIGTATMFMVAVGMMTGHYIGVKAGRLAEALGGVGLILIGTKILLEHLGVI